MNTLSLLIPVIVTGVLLALMPRLYRPNLVFGNTVAAEFRNSAQARSARRTFERDVLLWSLLAGLLVLGWPSETSVRAGAVPVLQVGGVLWSWLRLRRRLRVYAVAPATVREAQLAVQEEGVYGGWLAWLLPFVVLGVAALYIHQNWGVLPDQVPTHYGVNGPDAWAPRSWRTVYSPLIIGALVMTLVFTLGAAMAYGSRRGSTPEQDAFRRANAQMMLGLHWAMAILFAVLGTAPVREVIGPAIPFWLPVGILLVVLIGGIWRISAANQVSPGPDPTPDECWHAGDFYYNPADPALIVEKRFGIGYTINLAHKATWLFVAQLVLIGLSVVFLARG